MRLISRTIFREIFVTAILGAALFTFVLFLQQAAHLFEFLVRTSGPPRTVAYLFALVLPVMLPFAIPLGVLIGTLVTLSRMSTDGEITAMRAAGVPGRRVVPAILTFGFLAMCCAAAASLWLTPWSLREQIRIRNILIASELTADVHARVFEEQFPNKVLYVSNVIVGPPSRWQQIFIADITPPAERGPSTSERGDNPLITLAPEAIAIPDPSANRLQLSLQGSTYETGKDLGDYRITGFAGTQALNAEKPQAATLSKPVTEMDTRPLYKMAYRTAGLDRTSKLDAQIEFNTRFALPLACILLSLAGVPLGVTTRRAGKSGAVVLTVALALIYYIGLGTLVNLSKQGRLSPALAVWMPDLIFAVVGIAMLMRLEKPGDRDVVGRILAYFRGLTQQPQPQRLQRVLDRQQARMLSGRFPLVPQIIDRYVLASFLFYFLTLLLTFVAIFHIFEFFQLLSDIIRNGIGLGTILRYHFFLTPRLIYDFTPIGVLAAVLVVFAILSKHNEITAFKACGISAHRLTAPILAACLCLSGGLFAFDHFWVPEADRLQDQLRSVIKGRAPQTYLHPERKWISTEHNRIYYYEYFDPASRVMSGVNVYEIDPTVFRLKRHIFAKRARWEPTLGKWEFQSGWSVDIDGNPAHTVGFDSFPDGIRTFKELDEGPGYFMREAKQSRQMNFQELENYIADLQKKGFDTVSLQVQLNKKFSVPMFAFIMAMVSIPFAFLAGNRGAMAGVGVSLAIAIAYWSVDKLFEQVGALGQLPPEMAAWSPDAIFSLAGLYFLVRMRT